MVKQIWILLAPFILLNVIEVKAGIFSRFQVKKFAEIVADRTQTLTNDKFFLYNNNSSFGSTEVPFFTGIFRRWGAALSKSTTKVKEEEPPGEPTLRYEYKDYFFVFPLNASSELFDVRCPNDYIPNEPIYFRNTNNCVEYFKCDNRNVIPLTCPSGQVFSDINSECATASRRHCRKYNPYKIASQYYCRSAYKTQKLFFPDLKKCHVYYKCVDSNAVQFHCPEPLHWNVEIDRCDWPENVLC